MDSVPEDTSSGSWKRIPRPGLPSLPSNTGLRTALLGYLGAVETSLRDRLSSAGTGSTIYEEYTPLSSSSSEEERVPIPLAGDGGVANGEGSSSAVDGAGHSGLRRRHDNPSHIITSPIELELTDPTPQTPPDTHQNLLRAILSLREDVLAYLPSRLSVPMPSAPAGPSAEWLRSLPGRLSLLDLSLSRPPPAGGRGLKGKEREDASHVQHARRKVIELVHAMLPSEEWAGWERLGWEDTDLSTGASATTARARLQRRATEGTRHETFDFDDEGEHQEPEYLFPNRTPSTVQALANRRRTIRSKSLGTANKPGSLEWLLQDMPPLVRTKTDPSKHTRDAVSSAADEAGGEAQGVSAEEERKEMGVEGVLDGALDRRGKNKLDKELPSDMGPTVAEALERAEGGTKLIEYDDLPFVWRNNEHIIEGYRFIPLHAATGPIPLLKSAFWWSNETINIHSHFVPTLFILGVIPLIIHTTPLPDAHLLDTAVLVTYLLAAVSCLFTSAGWHVLAGCASRTWFEWGACVDYIGISWLIAATFQTIMYDAYYCRPRTIFFYSFTNLCCGLCGSILPFQKWFNERRNKNWRIAFFLGICFQMLAPAVQLLWEYGPREGGAFLAVYMPSVFCYIFGLIFYAFHFPECTKPGHFDYWFASHQIWHASIVLAIILHYRAIFIGHSQRYAYSCMAPDAGLPISVWVETWWRDLVSS